MKQQKVLLAICYLYVCAMTNELYGIIYILSHCKHNSVSSQLPHLSFLNILRHYGVTFFANWVGGGV